MSNIEKRIIALLPSANDEGQAIPSDLVGSRILAFGTYGDGDLDFEGGLVIEYETSAGELKRVELGFTELGMWAHNDR
ncbi:hypothetical protein [Rhizobium sp. BK251]|uniref:hypothetical protein n=1 Tax=Rhizobium sp. BK251 TaxID=2512125 RepID=UPI00104BC619|nr:hypothetical protein [Rhizobium sp. BK251]TCL70643.1 hypothetical protein EV286_107521 [Rhizobium sp. BK251]